MLKHMTNVKIESISESDGHCQQKVSVYLYFLVFFTIFFFLLVFKRDFQRLIMCYHVSIADKINRKI